MEAITEALNEVVERSLCTEAPHLWIVDSDREAPGNALNLLLEKDVDKS